MNTSCRMKTTKNSCISAKMAGRSEIPALRLHGGGRLQSGGLPGGAGRKKLDPIESLLERIALLEKNIYTTKQVFTFQEACMYTVSYTHLIALPIFNNDL